MSRDRDWKIIEGVPDVCLLERDPLGPGDPHWGHVGQRIIPP